MADYTSVKLSIKLLKCERVSSGGSEYIRATFSDDENSAIEYMDNGQSFFTIDQYSNIVKKMLVLDWLQESVSGKTATLDCSTPDDIWIKAELV